MLEVVAFVIMMSNISSESSLVDVPGYFGSRTTFETIDACEAGREVIIKTLEKSNSRYLKFYCVPMIKVKN